MKLLNYPINVVDGEDVVEFLGRSVTFRNLGLRTDEILNFKQIFGTYEYFEIFRVFKIMV